MTTSVVIYATLALLALTIPSGLVSWSRNFAPNPLQQAMLHLAEGIQSVSESVGAGAPYARMRALFLQWTGKRDD